MSASKRQSLRQAAVAALFNMGRAPYPTMAGPHVYDSKGDEIIHHRDQSQIPSIIVYTDKSVGEPATNMNGWPLTQQVELILELAMSADTRTATDSALEARLDEFEQQVMDLLFDSVNSDVARKFRKLFSKIVSYESFRIGHANSNERLAMRSVSIVLEVKPECKDYSDVFPSLETIGMVSASAIDGPPQDDAAVRNAVFAEGLS